MFRHEHPPDATENARLLTRKICRLLFAVFWTGVSAGIGCARCEEILGIAYWGAYA
jgi:hypothetical protein